MHMKLSFLTVTNQWNQIINLVAIETKLKIRNCSKIKWKVTVNSTWNNIWKLEELFMRQTEKKKNLTFVKIINFVWIICTYYKK